MTNLLITPRIEENSWAIDIDDPDKLSFGLVEAIGNLPDGMSSGLPATQILARLNDGRQVVVQVSYKQLLQAVAMLHAVWGHPE